MQKVYKFKASVLDKALYECIEDGCKIVAMATVSHEVCVVVEYPVNISVDCMKGAGNVQSVNIDKPWVAVQDGFRAKRLAFIIEGSSNIESQVCMRFPKGITIENIADILDKHFNK
jgi:hypothetical protein